MKNEIIKRLEGATELSLSLRKKILYKEEPKYSSNIYNVKYISEQKKISKSELDSILINFNKIFSTYIPDSEISIVNRSNGQIRVSDEFGKLFSESKIIYHATDGMFDPTVGPLVNVWGFGPDRIDKVPSEAEINQLMEFIGFDKITYEDGHIYKKFKESYIDFSSIAKGYAVDVIHNYLKQKNIRPSRNKTI